MRQATVLCGVLVLAGCRQLLGIDDPIVGQGAIDAPAETADATVDTPGGPPYCFGHPANVGGQICLNALPTDAFVVTLGTFIATDSGSPACSTATTDPVYCVLAYTSITISGSSSVVATGGRPLVLLSTSTIQVSGTIDVASHRTGQTLGAAANPNAGCAPGTAPTNAGGGAGASFGLAGGNGGAGDGGTGGIASGAILPATFRGGCQGGTGANGMAAGGNGGGAVALFATTTIDIDGVINASGRGGDGAASGGSGGGGGGSGGMIVLDAQTITGTGQIFANGGGGGEGSSAGAAGGSGSDPTAPASGGVGGTNNLVGGDGGHGSLGAAGGAAGGNGPTNAGGGGGGGGAGVIRAYGSWTFTGMRSPT